MSGETTRSGKRQSLGEILRFLGVLSEGDLERALFRQTNDGGRLGTCLLEAGLVDEETLLAALGAQQRAETVTAARMESIPDGFARLLPARAAVIAGAVPVARDGATLEVAMMEPGDIGRVDDLARVTRMRIVPKLALELRVVAALERLYDLDLSERLARLRRKLASRGPSAACAGESAGEAEGPDGMLPKIA
jgi:type IV pilus assembly protein PilB